MAEKEKGDKIPDVPDKRVVLIELSCFSKQCTPCTYPNCQRYMREMANKKKPSVAKVTEISHQEYKKLKKGA